MADPGSLANGLPRAPGDLMRRFADMRRLLEQLTAQIAAPIGDWTPATLVNSWTPVSEDVQYRLQPDGDVRLQGRVQSGTAGAAFTLGAGFRPLVRSDFIVATDTAGSDANVRVSTGGVVTVTLPAGATWASLSSIRFPTS